MMILTIMSFKNLFSHLTHKYSSQSVNLKKYNPKTYLLNLKIIRKPVYKARDFAYFKMFE